MILTASPDAVQHEHRLVFQAQPLEPASSSSSSSSSLSAAVTLAVKAPGAPFDGHLLCRDAATARDFPGPGSGASDASETSGCADSDAGQCSGWASQGECIHNRAFMLRRCALSCGVCRPGGLRLVRPPGPPGSAPGGSGRGSVTGSVGEGYGGSDWRRVAEDCSFVIEEVMGEEDEAAAQGDGRGGGGGGGTYTYGGGGVEEICGDGDGVAAGGISEACRRRLLPYAPPPGSFVARGPNPRTLPFVLMSPLTLLRDEVYTVYVRLKGAPPA